MYDDLIACFIARRHEISRKNQGHAVQQHPEAPPRLKGMQLHMPDTLIELGKLEPPIKMQEPIIEIDLDDILASFDLNNDDDVVILDQPLVQGCNSC